MTERTINAERVEQLIDVFGSFDENVKKIEQAFGVHITNRNTELKVTAEDEEAVDAGARAIEALLSLAAKGEEIDDQKVRYLVDLVRAGKEEQVTKMAKDVVCVTAKGRPVKAKTIGQQTYLKAISKNTITIGVGPAGTGKTYLAVAQAVAAFRAKEVNRIILTRPAVEAGERLGSSRAICRTRSTRICGRYTTRCLTCWGRRRITNISSAATLRLHPLPTCAAGRWMTASSFWTRRRTRRASR